MTFGTCRWRCIGRPLGRSPLVCRHVQTSANQRFQRPWAKYAAIATGGSAAIAGWIYWNHLESLRPRLDPDRYVPLTLMTKQIISPDSYRMRFTIESNEDDFPVPSSLFVVDDAIQVMRPYTPINSQPYRDGFIDLIVKRYDNGSVSRTLTNTNVGDKIRMRGPMVESYLYQRNSKDELGMIAGGTGITPMLQLIHRVLEDPQDKTRIWLLYANKTEKDILLREDIDRLQAAYPDRFSVLYVLESPPQEWKGATGRVTDTLVKHMMQDKQAKRLVFVSGPDGMVTEICGQRARDYSQGKVAGILAWLGLSSDQVWKFQ